MTFLFIHDLFEEKDAKNKGYRDILTELVENFITKNIKELEQINNPESLMGTLELTYNSNGENSQDKNNNG